MRTSSTSPLYQLMSRNIINSQQPYPLFSFPVLQNPRETQLKIQYENGKKYSIGGGYTQQIAIKSEQQEGLNRKNLISQLRSVKVFEQKRGNKINQSTRTGKRKLESPTLKIRTEESEQLQRIIGDNFAKKNQIRVNRSKQKITQSQELSRSHTPGMSISTPLKNSSHSYLKIAAFTCGDPKNEILYKIPGQLEEKRYKGNKVNLKERQERRNRLRGLKIARMQKNYDDCLRERKRLAEQNVLNIKSKLIILITDAKREKMEQMQDQLINSINYQKKKTYLSRERENGACFSSSCDYQSCEKLKSLALTQSMLKIHEASKIQMRKAKNRQVRKKSQFQSGERAADQTVSKLLKILHFNKLVLVSFGCYQPMRNIQEMERHSRRDVSFRYYVGPGNNRNLILSLMRRRWWWKQTIDIKNAHFVWSQVKIQFVLEREVVMKYSCLQEINPSILRSHKRERKLFGKVPQNDKELLLQKLFSPHFQKSLQRILLDKEQSLYLRQLKPVNLLHNHYKNNFMLGNKKALLKILRFHIIMYKQQPVISLNEIIPLTFHIQNFRSQQYRSFEQFYKNGQRQGKNIWIIKPGENSNRGNGIIVTDDLKEINAQITDIKRKNKESTVIVQKYISNLLLYKNRKFDIRTYLLQITIGGVTKFYWFAEGYLRTSSEFYDLSQLQNVLIHLTNDAIQSKGQGYGKFQRGNKLSYLEFQKYLDFRFKDKKYSVEQLAKQMKSIATKVAQAAYPLIDLDRKQCGFELYGMDFLVDANFKPWLLQVNTNPCLQLSSPQLERLIPTMIENLLRMALDPLFPPDTLPTRQFQYYIPQNPLESNKFELIFDSLFDRDYAWEQYCKFKFQTKFQDEDEVYEDEGKMLNLNF